MLGKRLRAEDRQGRIELLHEPFSADCASPRVRAVKILTGTLNF
jgi:hypothetical protein